MLCISVLNKDASMSTDTLSIPSGQDKMESRTDADTPSAFHFYSFGHVANNKPRGSWNIEVSLTEKFPFADGELSSHVETLEVKGSRNDGTAYASSATVGKTVNATWLPFSEPNRFTAPDVRRGMPVIIVKMGDSLEYFWITANSISKLMRLETVTMAYNADPNGPTKDDLSNAYVFQVSTHDKHILLQTSKTNGEYTTYTVCLNGGEGQAYLSDDLGNQFLINSQEGIVEMRNAAGSVYQLDKERIYEECSGDKVSKIGGSVTEEVGGSYNTTASGPRTVNAAGINHNSSGNSSSSSSGTTSISGSEIHLN